jgi:aryl-alcohol dehydrogenase-like predicted oxidoreductase
MEVLPTCRELGIAFVAASPLGRGFLTGQIKSLNDLAPDDWRRNGPRFKEENFYENLDLVKQIETMAQAKGVTPSQLALAWVLAKGDDIIPIPGTKRLKYLEQNAAAASIKLSIRDIAELDAALPPGAAAGTRYPEHAMKAVNR